MATKLLDRVAGTVQTTDATQTTVCSYTLPDACIAIVTGRAVGRQAATGDSVAYEYVFAFKRHAGGGAASVGAGNPVCLNEDAGAAAWNFTIDTSGNDIRMRVTGAAAKTIEWSGELDILLYVP